MKKQYGDVSDDIVRRLTHQSSAAVNTDRLAGHEARLVAGEESNHGGDFLHIPNPDERVPLGLRLLHRVVDVVRDASLVEDACLDKPGVDRVHSHSFASEVYSRAPGG